MPTLMRELLTPAGNWSSYPPHRHDDSPECPVNNEEIYYFRIGHGTGSGIGYSPDGFALHRTYVPAAAGSGRGPSSSDDVSAVDAPGVDISVAVGDGDVFVIPWLPRAMHAAPGIPYYSQRPRRSRRRALEAARRSGPSLATKAGQPLDPRAR